MAIQGIIKGFAAPNDWTKHAILIGRGSGYSLVVDGLQQGEQESTLDAGFAALKKVCDDKPAGWVEVRGTSMCGVTGVTTVREVGASLLGDSVLEA